MRNDFEKAMHFRHACKLFDTTKTISSEDLDFILEAGRLSPSSFGMEQWHFFIIRNPELRESIRQVAWNQFQITTSSELIAIGYQKKVRSTDPYILQQFDQFRYPPVLRELYRGWIDARSDEAIEYWSAAQAYIAATNMMTAAAYIGIDSCPIEGFDRVAVEKLMGIDTERYGIALLMPFGYRVHNQKSRHRSKLSDLVSYL